MTGTRLVPLDPRRARGARGKLRQTLLDGPNNGPEPPQRWTDFSSAMDRQAVGEALNVLPHQQRQVVKLAYFGGLTNREIADQLGVPVGGVRRRLRQALATAGEYVERGRATGYRVVGVLVAWFVGRSFETVRRSSGAGVEHIVKAGMVVVAGITASAVIGVVQSPAQPAQIGPTGVPAVKSTEASTAHAPNTSMVPAVVIVPQSPAKSDELLQRPGMPSIPVTVTVPTTVPDTVPATVPVTVPSLPVNLPVPSPQIPELPTIP